MVMMLSRSIFVFLFIVILALNPASAGKGGKKGSGQGGKEGNRKSGKKSMGKKGCQAADSRTAYYYQRMANAWLTEVSEVWTQ